MQNNFKLDSIDYAVLNACRRNPELAPRSLVLKTGFLLHSKKVRADQEQRIFASLLTLVKKKLIRLVTRCDQTRAIITCMGIRELLNMPRTNKKIHRTIKLKANALAVGITTLVAACATSPKVAPTQSPVFGVSEVGNDTGRRYELCVDCAQPTPKTMAKGTPAVTPKPVITDPPTNAIADGVRQRSDKSNAGMSRDASELSKQVVKIYFQSGKAEPVTTDTAELRRLVARLSSEKSLFVRGATDATGSVELNEKLALRRAQATKALLVNLGVKESVIKTEGCISCYDDSNESAEGRQRNRRVDVMVVSAKGQEGAAS